MVRTIVGAALCATFALSAADAQTVEIKGQQGKVLHNQAISATSLSDLNDKYQLRVSETTFEPGGSVGPHHHAGPGIRCLQSGELTYEADGKATIYKAGQCFYESGNVSHTARNATDKPLVFHNFEILPVSVTGRSIIPVPASR
jgi:quercetin dioxygenase-like cupin family protein